MVVSASTTGEDGLVGGGFSVSCEEEDVKWAAVSFHDSLCCALGWFVEWVYRFVEPLGPFPNICSVGVRILCNVRCPLVAVTPFADLV